MLEVSFYNPFYKVSHLDLVVLFIICHTVFPYAMNVCAQFHISQVFIHSFFLFFLSLSSLSYVEYNKLITTFILTPPPDLTGLTYSNSEQ